MTTAPRPPSPQTARPHPERTATESPSSELESLFHLILLDDDDHTYPYVIEMLGRVLGYAKEKAYVLACIVDAEGQVTLETASHEQVTTHQSGIHGYGPDRRIPHCKGSMTAIVERAE